jgi:hypothetical protein
MAISRRALSQRSLSDALAATLWFEPNLTQQGLLNALLDSGSGVQSTRSGATELPRVPKGPAQGPGQGGAAATLLRHAVFIAPQPVRPYFAVCALEAWRRVPVRQLAGWSGIPFTLLKRRLAAQGLTPSGVAAWNFALHATWLLDVAELPASTVVSCMRLGRPAALAAVLGARGVPFFAGQLQPGAFSATLERYLDVLRAAFRA